MARRFRIHMTVIALTVLVPTMAAACSTGGPGTIDRSAAGAGTQVLVSMGDSYISGTAGRWRGNTNGLTNVPQDLESFARSDTGANAYDDFGRRSPGDQCFRSRSAPIHLGGGWTSVNLACSDARTDSRVDASGRWKPGLDGAGQLAMLADIARRDTVRLVAVSIGANDFQFGPVVEKCATGFLTSLAALPLRCSEDRDALATIAPASVARVRTDVAQALVDIVSTMRAAGYADDEWVLVSNDYPNPLPPSSAMRHPQSGYTRQIVGGCPFYDADLDWFATWMATVDATVSAAAKDASEATGKTVTTIAMSNLFEGRRLCEKGTRLIEETADDAELLAFGERVDMIRLASILPGSPYDISEGVHPNQLGQSAIRACLRAAFAEGDARSGTCRAPLDWGAVDANGEPLVRFTPS